MIIALSSLVYLISLNNNFYFNILIYFVFFSSFSQHYIEWIYNYDNNNYYYKIATLIDRFFGIVLFLLSIYLLIIRKKFFVFILKNRILLIILSLSFILNDLYLEHIKLINVKPILFYLYNINHIFWHILSAFTVYKISSQKYNT